MEISDSSNYKSIEDKIMSPICSWRAMPFPRLISNLRPKFLNEKNSAKRVHQKKHKKVDIGAQIKTYVIICCYMLLFIMVSLLSWRSPSAIEACTISTIWDSAKGPVRLLTHHPFLLQKLAGLRPLGDIGIEILLMS